MSIVTYDGPVCVVIEVIDFNFILSFVTVVQSVVNPVQCNSTCKMIFIPIQVTGVSTKSCSGPLPILASFLTLETLCWHNIGCQKGEVTCSRAPIPHFVSVSCTLYGVKDYSLSSHQFFVRWHQIHTCTNVRAHKLCSMIAAASFVVASDFVDD